MIRRHLEARIHRTRCQRDILLPMLDKLDERELQALYRLIEQVADDESLSARTRALRTGRWPGMR